MRQERNRRPPSCSAFRAPHSTFRGVVVATGIDGEFRDRLAVEVEAWQREGLITPAQATAIRARYALRGTAARAVRIGSVAAFVSIVGAIVLGLGVILFFAANWSRLPDWFKVLLVFAGTGGAYAAGYQLQFRSRSLPRVGAALILLGAILFQSGIFLLEQIYNMPVDSPIALLLGAAGILPLAYAVNSPLVLVLALLDWFIWLGWELSRRFPDSPQQFAVPLMYLLAGVIVYALGGLHRLRRDRHGFMAVYQVLGLAAIFLPAYVLSFGGLWDEVSRRELGSFVAPAWFAGAVLLALLGAASLLTARREDRTAPVEAAVFAVVALAAALTAWAPGLAAGYALLFNAVFFGLALLAGVRGYLEGEARFINIGIAALALGLITRYFDTFWGLLPGSAFYIIGGLVLLAVAAGLERLRQRLLAGMGGADGGTAEARP